ncbi:unnamed protein product, partial [Dicrocoelium dendriticum]
MAKPGKLSGDEIQPLTSDPGVRIASALESLSDAMRKMTTNLTPAPSTPPLPPPEKFFPGMPYLRWEKQVQMYVNHFPAQQRGTVIMGLLAGEAFDKVTDSKVLDGEVTTETFAALRRILDRPGLPDERRRVFHARYQRPGENVETFVRELRRMAVSAYTDETPEQQDERVLEQLLEGIQTPSVKREFRLRRPTCLQAALTVADQLEQVDESMGPMEPCCALNRYSPARFQPPDRRNWNRVPFRGDYSRRPVQSYFRRPRPLHQEEEISRQAVAGEIFKVSAV